MASARSNLLKPWLAVITMLLFLQNAGAQEEAQSASGESVTGLIFSNSHHFRPVVGVQLLPKMIFNQTAGSLKDYSLAGTYNFGITYGYDYVYSFKRLVALSAGIRVIFFSRGTRYRFPQSFTGFDIDYETYFDIHQAIEFPILAVLRHPLKKRHYMRYTAGPVLRLPFPLSDESFSYRSETSKNYLSEYNFTTPYRPVLLDLSFSCGFEMQTRAHHLFSVEAGVNLSFLNVLRSQYRIVENGELVAGGTSRQNLSYMELRLGYTFTWVRKKLKRLKDENQPVEQSAIIDK